MKLRTLSSTTLYFKDGKLIETDANPIKKKENVMTKRFAPNTKQEDGSGVPEMPVMEFGEKKGDAITNVKAHLISLHGEKEGMEKLRTMSGLKLLELAEELKGNEDETQIVHEVDGQQQFSMPKMKIC